MYTRLLFRTGTSMPYTMYTALLLRTDTIMYPTLLLRTETSILYTEYTILLLRTDISIHISIASLYYTVYHVLYIIPTLYCYSEQVQE